MILGGCMRNWAFVALRCWGLLGGSHAQSRDSSAAAFGIHLGRNTGECQCWPAATEQEALEQCRGQCDALGEKCSAFEYSYNTNIHQKKLGPRCCFRSQVGDASLSLRSV